MKKSRFAIFTTTFVFNCLLAAGVQNLHASPIFYVGESAFYPAGEMNYWDRNYPAGMIGDMGGAAYEGERSAYPVKPQAAKGPDKGDATESGPICPGSFLGEHGPGRNRNGVADRSEGFWN